MSSEVKPRLRGTDINKKLKMKINARRPQIASNVAPLNPWYIAGFTDGEGSWGVTISKNLRETGYTVLPKFTIGLHACDIALLERIAAQFGVGGIYVGSNNLVRWQVSSVRDLVNVIIPFFEKYPLVSQKRADFELFKQIVELINNKEHLTPAGLQKIVNLKASLNLGNSGELKALFPNTIPVARPLVKFTGIPNPHWLSGFTDADGCFYVSTYASPKSKLGMAVQLVFVVTQHVRDQKLLEGLIDYIGCGRYSKRKEAGDFKVLSIADINKKIIPFFSEYQLQGVKSHNLADFRSVARFQIMEAKGHLTTEGLEQIQAIKMGMNKGRVS
jgi:hypothetical protein